METGTAALRGVGDGSEAHNRGCKQGCCDQIFHVFSLIAGRIVRRRNPIDSSVTELQYVGTFVRP
jgi:hypothetical protein